MIEFESNVTGSFEKGKVLRTYLPKSAIIKNNLENKKFLLLKFHKNKMSFIDVVPLQTINYNGYKWFSISIPKIDAKNIGIKLHDKIKISVLDSKTLTEAKLSSASFKKDKTIINSLELFFESINTHQSYRKNASPETLFFENKDKFIFWWNSNPRLLPLTLPQNLRLNPDLVALAGSLRGEGGSSDAVTTGEFVNTSPDFINFVLNAIEQNLDIQKEQWKGRIEYRGPNWNSKLEKKLEEFWSYTTGIKDFYKSRFTKVEGVKSIPCGELMVHTGGILLKEALNGLVTSIENRLIVNKNYLPFYITGLLSAEGGVQLGTDYISTITIYTNNDDSAKFYQLCFHAIGINTSKSKDNEGCDIIRISGWDDILRLYEILLNFKLSPFKFSLPYRDILFFRGLSNHCSTQTLLNLEGDNELKTSFFQSKIKDETGKCFSRYQVGKNLANLIKNGFLEGKRKKEIYRVKITQKGLIAKNALEKLPILIQNAIDKSKNFNLMLQKFGLGKIEIDKKMRIRTIWSSI